PAPAGTPAAGDAGRSEIETLLRRLVSEGGSDLHLCSGNPAFIRKDGAMHAWKDTGPYAAGEIGRLLDAITPERYRERFAETGDADFSHEVPGLARFRCNRFNDRLGPGAVMRVIPVEIPSAEKLEVPRAALDLCDLHKGLVLVTGPTGSGKSTTLASMIDRINRTRPAHIITIEDPIEFIHRNQASVLNQREVGAHTSTFKAALRAALREDPDIVLVGEMRDLETIAIALETAETGHLVFGTLHTNTAPSTVDRIIEVFPTERQNQIRAMLAESLKGVIAQTLLRRKGGGRIAAREVLIVNPAISNLIREGKTFQIPTMMQTGRGLGMVTMNDALVDLVRKGLVDVEEALGKAPSRSEFQASMQRASAAAAG
ncbi:MAG TPA: type IV pilus twitching motility protein PilT, partial [Candidatus Saccharimonadales bacterium]|nr:type IV pilus twitching motility protein PilT [Candidatus Saccharimonadales bacterium]